MDLEERRREHFAAARLRRRLWGAAVLIALGVVGLPLLLDGSGSESRFRRVERLREEPPRLVTSEDAERRAGEGGAAAAGESSDTVPGASGATGGRSGAASDAEPPASGAADGRPSDAPRAPAAVPREPVVDGAVEPARVPRPGEASDVAPAPAPAAAAGGIDAADDGTSVWVVQAGSFGESARAVAVRDRLREAGYPAFVDGVRAEAVGAGGTRSMFRVQVGPLVGRGRAEEVRDEIGALLGGDAIVVGYR